MRLAEAFRSDQPYQPEFAHAVTRHKRIGAIERSAPEGRTIQLNR